MIIKQKLAGKISFDYKWYDIYNCDDHDIRLLKDEFDLTSEIISYITDLHERPHFDHDYITNSDLLVYDVQFGQLRMQTILLHCQLSF